MLFLFSSLPFPLKKIRKWKGIYILPTRDIVLCNLCFFQVNNLICIENFADFAQLGRFTLRTEGKLFFLFYAINVKLPFVWC